MAKSWHEVIEVSSESGDNAGGAGGSSADSDREDTADKFEAARPEEAERISDKFRIASINARSLAGNGRLHELLAEAGDDEWDVIMVQETWRTEMQEDFLLEEGHRWIGAGGGGNKHEVGMLVHRRWVSLVQRVDVIRRARALAIELVCRGLRVRLVLAYLPHSWGKDGEYEALCTELVADARKPSSRGAIVFIGGDFNAEMGQRHIGEDEEIIGPHGSGSRNKRGDMMAKWAWSAGLSIANAFFQKPWRS